MPLPRPFTILKLVRIPNLPTAVADVLAGYFLIVSGAGWEWLQKREGGVAALGMGLFGSALLYMGGMANNDVQHAHKDTILKKHRPIVDGEISYGLARYLSTTMLLLGVLLMTLTPIVAHTREKIIGSALGGVALLLALAIVLYNKLSAGKSIDWSYSEPSGGMTKVSTAVMAICRVLNLGLGMLVGVAIIGQFKLVPDLTFEVFVALGLSFVWFLQLTRVSTLEDAHQEPGKLKRHVIAYALLAVAMVISHPQFGLVFGTPNDDWLIRLLSLGLLVVAIIVPALRYRRAMYEASPKNVGMIIKWSIISAPWIWASLVISQHPSNLVPGLVIAALPFVSIGLGRISYST